MNITIFYLFDEIFISAEKARWCLWSARSAGDVKYSPFPEPMR